MNCFILLVKLSLHTGNIQKFYAVDFGVYIILLIEVADSIPRVSQNRLFFVFQEINYRKIIFENSIIPKISHSLTLIIIKFYYLSNGNMSQANIL